MFDDASLAILCGGEGRRLGFVPKGLLVLDGRTFMDRLLDLRPLFADAFLVTSQPAPYERFGVRAQADGWVGLGMPGAVQTALAASKTDWTFVVGADMPLMSVATVEQLAKLLAPELDIVAAEVNGRVQPLGAFYRSSLCEPFGARLDADDCPSLLELQALARVKVVTPADPRAWLNANTPQELEALGASRPSAW